MIPPFASDPFSLTALEAFAQQIGGTSYPAALSEQFYELYIPHLEDSAYAFSATEMDSLYSWAQKCPYIYGQAVYQSRALLAEVADTLLGKTHCEVAYTTAQASSKTDEWSESTKMQQAKLYPNPVAPGEAFYLELEKEVSNIALYDLNGRLVKEWHGLAQSLWTLETTGLPQGIYMGRATNTSSHTQHFRLCIAY